jgi:excisionase family DNA binding protein
MRQARPTVTLHITPESPGREAAPPEPRAPRPTPPPARGDDRLLLTVVDAARRLEVSRSLMYELLAAGEIDSVHVGRLRRVPVDALTSYVARLRANGSARRPTP